MNMIKCFGADAVNAAFNKPTTGSLDGSILHLLPDLVKPQCRLAIVLIQLMKQSSFFLCASFFSNF